MSTVKDITRVMLDIDDVLNNFTSHAMRYLGCDNVEFPVECGYNIVAAINLAHPIHNKWTPNQVWTHLGERLWLDIPVSDLCADVVWDCVELVGQDNVFLCSSLTKNHRCTKGKLGWMDRCLPGWLRDQYILTPHKYLLANENTLLIDDYHGNTSDFEEAGGRTILVPRPWNPNNRYNTKSYVKGALSHLRKFKN